MIFIKNTQHKIKINIKALKTIIKKMLVIAGYKDFYINIWFTTNSTIKKYNKKYRNKNKATDILSFPFHNIKAGKQIKIKYPEDKNLGDLIISLEHIKKDALKLNQSFDQRIEILLAHG